MMENKKDLATILYCFLDEVISNGEAGPQHLMAWFDGEYEDLKQNRDLVKCLLDVYDEDEVS